MATHRWRISAPFGITLLAGAVALAAAIVAGDRFLDPFNGRPFEPTAWAANATGDRMAMARAAARRVRPGMAESEIALALGPPDGVWHDELPTGSAPGQAARTHSYGLGGSELSMLRGLDTAYLWVDVDADGRVIAAVIGGG